MLLKEDLQYQIDALNDMYDEFIAYNDSIDITDSNEKKFVTSNTLLSATQKCVQTAIQEIEQQKRDSLTEYVYTANQDTTLFNICFEVYKVVNETNIQQLITANDLSAFNRTDIDPNNPVIKKNTNIIYYK